MNPIPSEDMYPIPGEDMYPIPGEEESLALLPENQPAPVRGAFRGRCWRISPNTRICLSITAIVLAFAIVMESASHGYCGRPPSFFSGSKCHKSLLKVFIGLIICAVAWDTLFAELP